MITRASITNINQVWGKSGHVHNLKTSIIIGDYCTNYNADEKCLFFSFVDFMLGGQLEVLGTLKGSFGAFMLCIQNSVLSNFVLTGFHCISFWMIPCLDESGLTSIYLKKLVVQLNSL